MFGIVFSTILGLCGYIFSHKNFYECYLSSTEFLFWWTISTGVVAFLLRRIKAGMPEKFCRIFSLPKLVARRTFLRGELLFCFFALFSVGAAYLLHSSLAGLEGLRYWDDLRLVFGISMYCAIVLIRTGVRSYTDFRKTKPGL